MKLSNKFYKINRALHRDLGYLFVGLTLIYGISGIAVVLRHYDINVSYSETVIEQQLDKNLNKKQLKAYWTEHVNDLPKLSRVYPPDEEDKDKDFRIRVKAGRGRYNPETGDLKITTYKARKFFKFVNDIHYNVGGRFTWMGILYGAILVFFAISGAIMVKGKNGFMKRGIWFVLAGLAVPIILYFFF